MAFQPKIESGSLPSSIPTGNENEYADMRIRKRSGKKDESVSTGKRDEGGEVSRKKSAESGNSGSTVAGSVEKIDVQSNGGGDKSLVFFGNVNKVFSLDEL
ncbi:hypothetical protein LR48_Vigan09g100700 [Vigna angularis]|uniref:Uncharacterized protein n=1 Tax=Phaseolus angularis TaxID=3914 RepID=A0A0L9VBF9_PHAAN|nr:hypothetical protein LR48_Vigan09g100700 [Vigna angularis]